MVEFIDEIILSVCADNRITEGIFFIEDDTHMAVLREKLENLGIQKDTVTEISNAVLEGKFPERQCYNADGILVTFPTPEYKAAAIARGTHFEENPKKQQVNIFQGQQPSATGATPQPDQTAPQPEIPAPEDKVPNSQSTPSPAQHSPSTTEKPLDDAEAHTDDRTPEEKKIDGNAIEKILGDAPTTVDISTKYPNLEETIKYTLNEAIINNFYEKDGKWYTSEGKYVGKQWICHSSKEILIFK